MTGYPGALWRPISRNYTARPRHATRGVILHVAASEASSLHGWFDNPAAQASSHLYVRRDGTLEQYVPMEQSAWTSGTASYTTIGVETQGGADGPWTPEQVEALARICAWAHTTYDIPLRAMTSSRASERGVGWHRLGVAATRDQLRRGISQTGGPLWSKSAGKVCPGDQRIRQVPDIIARAKQITTGDDGREWFTMATKNDLVDAITATIPAIARAVGDLQIKIGGATKRILKVDAITLLQGVRYGAAAWAEQRDLREETRAELAALHAVVGDLARGQGVDPATVRAAVDTALAEVRLVRSEEV